MGFGRLELTSIETNNAVVTLPEDLFNRAMLAAITGPTSGGSEGKVSSIFCDRRLGLGMLPHHGLGPAVTVRTTMGWPMAPAAPTAKP
jgi:hypothetical protein